jgi:hypothetical protein
MATHDDVATVITFELGTETITLECTESGTFDQATITTDGDDGTVITKLAGNVLTTEAGTATGEMTVDGIVTVGGATTNNVAGIVTIDVTGTATTDHVGTELGTFDQATITTELYDVIVMTYVHGNV